MNSTVSDSPFFCSAEDAEAVVKSVSLLYFQITNYSLKIVICRVINENKD